MLGTAEVMTAGGGRSPLVALSGLVYDRQGRHRNLVTDCAVLGQPGFIVANAP